MAGVIDFYQECKKNNIKPILGCEAYLTEDLDDAAKKNRDNFHLVLLARNNKGLENLTWLISQANLHNFYYKPRIYRRHLEERAEGLIATSACLAGYPARLLRWEHSINKLFCDCYSDYVNIIKWFQEVFSDNYYLEVQDHDFWEQKVYNEWLIDFARKEKFPLVVTSDAHYLRREDHTTHEMLMAMQFKMTLEEYRQSDSIKYGSSNYIKSYEEVLSFAREKEIPEAVENTVAIAEQCQVELEFGKYKLPMFNIKETDDYKEFRRYLKSG
jgi:DNA polymerase-3 subunit alpha